ncbi:AAA ATPase [Coemansia brasiliensis]|uniref:Cell division control protein n=1 Tax=Coemansia brasiliensis TaxID=2650707 RepID=A0A9W8IE59_9FUNG|nr:AAA ATPase [Coemansia brasiliensis]
MPATRSARLSTRRQALSEAPLSKQQVIKPVASKLKPAQTLKTTFSVTKHSQPNGKASKLASPFIAAKSMLHRSTAAPQIVGREAEQLVIRQFLQGSVEQDRGGSMYISGNPGTGKTACLQALIKQSEASFTSVLVNCVPLTRPGQVYEAILDALGVPFAGSDSALSKLEHLVFQSRAFLVILDEVDSLLGSRQEVLYRLFELAAHKDSHLALVGIANALDLTDRFLPRLQARNCEPLLLNFNPYQVKDIVEILQSRLDSVSREPIIQKAALELCARKVAATSGDLRKSLDVCRQAMEMAEAEHRRQAQNKENHNEGQPKVTLVHIAKVLTNLNGSPTMQKLDALNFQQKLVLCAHLFLAAANKTKKLGEMAVSALYTEYRGICSRLNMMAPVTRSEFLDLVAMMETQGVVAVDASKHGRRSGRRIVSSSGAADDRTMRLLVDESDARRALNKTPALAPLF